MTDLTELLDLEEEQETSRTYTDTDIAILPAKIDGIEALKAAIAKRISTEQYDCPLYSFDYGLRTLDLLGKDIEYVTPELKRRITECLLADDRITEVKDFSYSKNGDNLLIKFTASSIFGSIDVDKEVYNV